MNQFRIFKYTLLDDLSLKEEIYLAKGARVLSVEEQNDTIVLYALTPLHVAENDTWNVKVVGTGHTFEVDESWQFVGTVKMADGKLMFHVWVKKL
jgi:hypothetical protein